MDLKKSPKYPMERPARSAGVVSAAAEDAAPIAELIRRSVAEVAYPSYPPNPKKLEEWLHLIQESGIRAAISSGENYRIGVIRDARGMPIAMGTFDLKKSRGVQLYVSPDHAREGLGGQVARWLDEVALTRGISSFFGEAALGALGFWIKNGHVATGRTRLFLDYFPVIEVRREVPLANSFGGLSLPQLTLAREGGKL